MTEPNKKEGDHRGIQNNEQKSRDLFLDTLWEIIQKELSLIRTHFPRFEMLWNKYLYQIDPNPHRIRSFECDKDKFFSDNEYKIQTLSNLQLSLVDGYYTVKSIVLALYGKYFPSSELFLKSFNEIDRFPLRCIVSDMLIGSLSQFMQEQKDIVPIKFVVIALNKSMLKLKGMTDIKIFKKIDTNGFNISIEEVHEIMDELVEYDYIEKRKLTPEELEKYGVGEFFYKLKEDFGLTREGEEFYKQNIYPSIEWAIQLWRSMYNVREINIAIPEFYKFREILEKAVSQAATQGFRSCYSVIKNIEEYYKTLLNEKE